PARSSPLTLSLHDALPIFFCTGARRCFGPRHPKLLMTNSKMQEAIMKVIKHLTLRPVAFLIVSFLVTGSVIYSQHSGHDMSKMRSEEHTSELQSRFDLVCR